MAAAGPALPYIVAGLGTAAQIVATSQANDERQAAINRMMDTGTAGSAQNRAIQLKSAEQYDPAARSVTLSKQTSRLGDQLEQAVSAAPSAAPVAGNVSTAYTNARETSAADAKVASDRLNALLANVMAPAQLQRVEGYGNADAASKGAQVASTTGSVLSGQRANYNTIEPNPALMIGGNIATQVGPVLATNDANARMAAALKRVMGGTSPTIPNEAP